MTVDVTTRVGIRLEVGCDYDICSQFAFPLYKQLASGRYGECSVLPIPLSIDEWRADHRTARKRADRAKRLGYTARAIRPWEHADEILEINTSMPERQGKPMAASYQQRPSESPSPEYPCWRHGVHPSGVFDADDTLRAYLWMYRTGELALVSSILGHADDLASDVMYLLFEHALTTEIAHGHGIMVYNRHDSGTDGLRYFKERLGFREEAVEWLR